MSRVVLLVVSLVALWGEVPDPQEAARKAQEAAVEIQRAAIRKQLEAVRAGAAMAVQGQNVEQVKPEAPVNAFFTLPDLIPSGQVAVDCDPVAMEELERNIAEAATREGLTPELLRAIIAKESAFRPCAVSNRGAEGLMQLMPATQAQFGVSNPFDPKQNIEAGAKFLRQLLDRYGGDLATALGAYNAGPARVDQFKGIPPIPETINYVSDVMKKIQPVR